MSFQCSHLLRTIKYTTPYHTASHQMHNISSCMLYAHGLLQVPFITLHTSETAAMISNSNAYYCSITLAAAAAADECVRGGVFEKA